MTSREFLTDLFCLCNCFSENDVSRASKKKSLSRRAAVAAAAASCRRRRVSLGRLFVKKKTTRTLRVRPENYGYPSPPVVGVGSASPSARARASASRRGENPRRRFQSGTTDTSATSW